MISGVPQGFVGLEGLPGSVDNSILDAFPEIRTQGSLGSCTTFAITYYQLTYMAGRKYGWNNKNVNNDRKFSPKWTYNMINRGVNEGSSPGNAYAVLERHGAATWTQFPYQTSSTDPKSYREWCLNSETWRNAISYRIYPHLWCTATVHAPGDSNPPITELEFGNWLTEIKTMLANDEVLTFATYISSWQFTSIQDDKSVLDDNAFVRKPVAFWVNGSQGGHMMTIVGYNDSIWTDINNNRKVDAGEKGALKIANSWGPGWRDSGFCWLAYDALRGQSAVAGGPSSAGRMPAMLGYGVFSIAVKYNYAPTLVAKFKLKHTKRDQLCVALTTFDGTNRTTWTPGALQNQGGPYAFDGTTESCEGTFVFDFTDILQYASGSKPFELWVADDDDLSDPKSFGLPDGYAAELLGYKLIDLGQDQPTASGGLYLPEEVMTADGTWTGDSLEYPDPLDRETVPAALATATPPSGRVPLTVQFDGSQSSDSGNDMYSYTWDFGDGSTQVQGVTATHTYSTVGTYAARLTVVDNSWAESSTPVTITATRGK